MKERSCHDEEVETFMYAELFMAQGAGFQRVDQPACGIHGAACEQHRCGGCAEGGEDLRHHRQAAPAHGDIDHGGDPLGAGDPAEGKDRACPGQGPYGDEHELSREPMEGDEADGRIGTGDEEKDHDVIQFF